MQRKKPVWGCVTAVLLAGGLSLGGAGAASSSGFTTQTISKTSDAHSFKGKLQDIDTTNSVITVLGHELTDHRTQKIVVSTAHKPAPKKSDPAKPQDKTLTFQVPPTCKVGTVTGALKDLTKGEVVTVAYFVETDFNRKAQRIVNEIVLEKAHPAANAGQP